MIAVSIEEPVVNNDSIHQKLDGKRSVGFDQSAGLAVNRYCFAFAGEDQRRNALNHINLIANELDLQVYGVVAWLKLLPGRSKIASQILASRYKKAGWSVMNNEDHYIAVMMFEDVVIYLNHRNISAITGDGLFLMGFDFDFSDFFKNSKKDIINMATYNDFIPSRIFMEYCIQKKVSFSYLSKSDRDCDVVISLTKETLKTDYIDSITTKKRTYRQEEAYKLFIE